MTAFNYFLFKKIFFCILFTIFIFTEASSQEPVYRKYTIENGLPSTEVYHVIQDKNGFLWFATSAGVSRYDGNKFQNFSTREGLPDNAVLELYEDYKGRIWFIPVSFKLSYFDNGKIYAYTFNDSISKYINEKNVPSALHCKFGFRVDSYDNSTICVRYHGLIEISNKGYVNKSKHSHFGTYYLPIFFKSGFEIAFNIGNIYKIHNHEIYFPEIPTSCSSNFCIENPKNQILLTICNNLHIIKNYKLIKNIDFQSKIIWLSCDRENNTWLSVYQDGLYCYKNGDMNSKPLHFFKNSSISSVLFDNENGLWLTSLNDGVYYVPSLEFKNIFIQQKGNDNKKFMLAVDEKNKIYIAEEESKLMIIDNKDTSAIKLSEYSYVPTIKYDFSNHWLLIGIDKKLFYLKNNKIEKIHSDFKDDGFSDIYSFYPDKNNSYYLSTSMGIAKIINNKCVYQSAISSEKFIFGIKTFGITKDESGNLWLATINGLWKGIEKINSATNKIFIEYKYYGDKNKLLQLRMNDICTINNKLFLATNDAGILIYSGDSIIQIDADNGLTGAQIKSLCYSNGILWAATNKGLNKIILNPKNNRSSKIFQITTLNGLISDDVNYVTVKDSVVYVGTSKGVTYFNYFKLKPNTIAPLVYINKIKINDKDTCLQNKFELTYKKNYINISFNGLAYRNSGKILYKLKMEGIDKAWIYTNSTNINYPFLPPGEYCFRVYACNEDGVWSSTPAAVTLLIKPPYWETWWFRTFIVAVLLLIITGLFMEYRRRSLLKQNMLIYQQHALTRQMNSHFIFNTLNSIQHFIMGNDKISSGLYLGKFATLMRIVLNSSRQKTVSLKSELEAIELYIELESLRFQGDIKYNIEVDSDIDAAQINIPPLLIQPIVENAIIHGLMHKQNKGFINIKVTKVNEKLICAVEDNGIGREKSMEINQGKTKTHKSLATIITNERIETINSYLKTKMFIEVTDLKDENNQPLGTRVTLNF
ncbi:MAG: two-component regulator propeller domain-containing protein [Bacteroidales bacterium]|jgi:ligand-binding sensor domain-containing protein